MIKNISKTSKQLFSLTLLVFITLTSCNKSNKIENDCEAFLKTQLNDPNSYERISIQVKDTLKTYKIEYISYEINYRAKNAMGALVKGRAIVNYKPNEKDPNKKFLIYSNE